MISSAIFLVAVSIGQICEPIYCPPVCIIVPTDYIYYDLDGMTERTRRYEFIEYGEYDPIVRRVPVINGYVPDVSKRRLESGGWRIIYDYSRRTRVSECLDLERPIKQKPQKTLLPSPERDYEVDKIPGDSLKNSKRSKIPEPTDSLKKPSDIKSI